MHQTKVSLILALLAFMTIGNFAAGSTQGGLVMSCVLVVFTYLAFVSRSATRKMHFTIGRYITISGIAVAIFFILRPIAQEILGGFGNLLSTLTGMTILFPTLVLRAAIMHRMKLLSEAEETHHGTTTEISS